MGSGLITSVAEFEILLQLFRNFLRKILLRIVSVEMEKTALVIPALDKSKAENSAADGIFAWTDSEGYSKSLSKRYTFVSAKGNIVGCEDSITLSLMDSFKAVRPQARLDSISQAISRLRVIKDEEELEAVRQSTKKLALRI